MRPSESRNLQSGPDSTPCGSQTIVCMPTGSASAHVANASGKRAYEARHNMLDAAVTMGAVAAGGGRARHRQLDLPGGLPRARRQRRARQPTTAARTIGAVTLYRKPARSVIAQYLLPYVERGFADPLFAADVGNSGAAPPPGAGPRKICSSVCLFLANGLSSSISSTGPCRPCQTHLSLAHFSGFGSPIDSTAVDRLEPVTVNSQR